MRGTARLIPVVFCLAAGFQSACRSGPDAGPEAPDEAAADVLAGFKVVDGSTDLLFQYYAPGTGEPKTATCVADVPQECRRNVVVFSKALKKGDLPASQIIVADLTQVCEDGTYPYKLVSRYECGPELAPDAAPAPGAPDAATSPDTVLVFTTPWCPHCKNAVAWLKANAIPFAEHNVESDPSARQLLLDLGRKAGMAENLLSTVPILYVKGQLILGFNSTEIQRVLAQ